MVSTTTTVRATDLQSELATFNGSGKGENLRRELDTPAFSVFTQSAP